MLPNYPSGQTVPYLLQPTLAGVLFSTKLVRFNALSSCCFLQLVHNALFSPKPGQFESTYFSPTTTTESSPESCKLFSSSALAFLTTKSATTADTTN